MVKVNAMGDACPIPVVKTKNAIKQLQQPGDVEVLVDNEIAVQNLTKMANQKGYGVTSEKLEEQKYRVVLSVTEVNASDAGEKEPAEEVCVTDARGDKVVVVVISSSKMGEGDDELGSILMKGFVYALTQQVLAYLGCWVWLTLAIRN